MNGKPKPVTETMAAIAQKQGKHPEPIPDRCTGHIEQGRLMHDGDTCPVHEDSDA